MHISLRFLAVGLMNSLSSAIVIPDSVPDSTPSGAVPPITPAAATTSQSGKPDQQHEPSQNMDIRILVCGDSITQGVEGQFTWRYRLWEWFHNNAESRTDDHGQAPSSSSSSSTTEAGNRNGSYQYPTMQYVGPYNGTLPSTSPSPSKSTGTATSSDSDSISISISAAAPDPYHPKTWGAYHPAVDEAFSPGGGSAHFAVYGRPAWQDVDLIGAQVQAYQPDYVLLHLGFNDIGWWSHRAADLVETMQKLVFRARLARRDVAVLIADVSHRVAVGGREDIPVTTDEYNQMIVEKAREWSTEGSPVEVVRVSEVYDCHVESCPAGFDGLHPNALGDFQIASAYTQVFHETFGFGSDVLEVPPQSAIPGMTSYSGLSTAVNAISSPVLAISAGVVLLFLVLATILRVLRPELLRLERFGRGKYRLLPST